jgi:hypothetical protein
MKARPAVVARDIQKNHDGRVYDLHIADLPAVQCSACGEVYFSSESDERISAALREHLGLLTPEQLRTNLAALHLTQKEAADRIGVAPETMSRWLSGAMIQSRAMDNLLRGFFGCSELRGHLSAAIIDRSFGVIQERGSRHG